jgi:hypothetical protein
LGAVPQAVRQGGQRVGHGGVIGHGLAREVRGRGSDGRPCRRWAAAGASVLAGVAWGNAEPFGSRNLFSERRGKGTRPRYAL